MCGRIRKERRKLVGNHWHRAGWKALPGRVTTVRKEDLNFKDPPIKGDKLMNGQDEDTQDFLKEQELTKQVERLVKTPLWKSLAKKQTKGSQSSQKQMKRLLRGRVAKARTRSRKLFMRQRNVRIYLEANKVE